MADQKKIDFQSKLARIVQAEEEQRAKELATKLKFPYVNLATLPIQPDALLLIDGATALQGEIAIFQRIENKLKIIVRDPQKPATQKILEDLKTKNFICSIFIVSAHSLAKALALYRELAKERKEITGKVEITTEAITRLRQELKTIEDIKKKVDSLPQDDATSLVEVIIAGSLGNDASDIHLESKEKTALIRYRIDGVLHDVVFLSDRAYHSLLARIKLLSEMVINVRDKAQDGRFTIRLENIDIEVRVSVIPGPNGENIVMRILNPKTINLNLKNLGFRDDIYDFITKEIQRPNGMLITTGPTGSGKTTTLYAFLNEVTDPEVKIITLEDPIEYHLGGVTQTQVDSERGYTFAAGLRAILRQDPDVVMVGEIRDKETAEVALHAALTGHIVFSTLHTNDAAGAIPRFIDMGANPTILSAALIDIMAQRLLRRVCEDCKEEYAPSAEEKTKIEKALAGLPKMIQPSIVKTYKLFRGKGCPACNNTGYKSRVGIYEVIHVDAAMEKLITKSPSHAEVLEAAKKQNFVSMYQDGVLKVLQGVTTLEELEDVVGSQS